MDQIITDIGSIAWKAVATGGGGIALIKIIADRWKDRQSNRLERDKERSQIQASFETTMLGTAQNVVTNMGAFLEDLVKQHAACEERCRQRDAQVQTLEGKVGQLEQRIETLRARPG